MSAKKDSLEVNGKRVNDFASQIATLGDRHMANLLLDMYRSEAWRGFQDGYGLYEFLSGEFDYFLTQQGVSRDDVMTSVRDISIKAMFEGGMDERRTGEVGYRRRILAAREVNPQRPGHPIMPFGYTETEAKALISDGASIRSAKRPALGSTVRRWTKSGGQTTLAPSDRLPPAERARRLACRLPDHELDQLIEFLRQERRRRRRHQQNGRPKHEAGSN